MKFVHIADMHFDTPFRLLSDRADLGEIRRLDQRKAFKKMIEYANSILGDQGFRKSLRSKSTPRARFEALAVGIGLALKERPQLEVVDISGWINEDEFANLTRSDAANNKAKLLARIEYVKDKILLEA